MDQVLSNGEKKMKVLVLGAGTVCEFSAAMENQKAAVVTVGARHGIETPVNTCIADQVRFRVSLPNR